MSADSMPTGVNSALQSHLSASMTAQSAGGQFKLLGILPACGFDSHPWSIQASALSFMQKNCLPGQGSLLDMLLPSGHGAGGKLMDKLFAFLKANSSITSMAELMNHAHDLTPEQLRQLASVVELHGSDIPASMLSQLSMNNAAMNLAAIHQHDDIGRG